MSVVGMLAAVALVAALGMALGPVVASWWRESRGSGRGSRPVGDLLRDLREGQGAARVDAARALNPVADGAPAVELYGAAPAVVPALLGGLGDDDPNVRKWSAWSLAGFVEHGDVAAAEALPPLLGGLADADRGVRLYCVWSLERLGPAVGEVEDAAAEVRDRLDGLRDDDPDRDVRDAARRAARAVRRSPAAPSPDHP